MVKAMVTNFHTCRVLFFFFYCHSVWCKSDRTSNPERQNHNAFTFRQKFFVRNQRPVVITSLFSLKSAEKVKSSLFMANLSCFCLVWCCTLLLAQCMTLDRDYPCSERMSLSANGVPKYQTLDICHSSSLACMTFLLVIFVPVLLCFELRSKIFPEQVIFSLRCPKSCNVLQLNLDMNQTHCCR